MPIEQKALAEARADHKTMEPLQIRKKGECLSRMRLIIYVTNLPVEAN